MKLFFADVVGAAPLRSAALPPLVPLDSVGRWSGVVPAEIIILGGYHDAIQGLAAAPHTEIVRLIVDFQNDLQSRIANFAAAPDPTTELLVQLDEALLDLRIDMSGGAVGPERFEALTASYRRALEGVVGDAMIDNDPYIDLVLGYTLTRDRDVVTRPANVAAVADIIGSRCSTSFNGVGPVVTTNESLAAPLQTWCDLRAELEEPEHQALANSDPATRDQLRVWIEAAARLDGIADATVALMRRPNATWGDIEAERFSAAHSLHDVRAIHGVPNIAMGVGFLQQLLYAASERLGDEYGPSRRIGPSDIELVASARHGDGLRIAERFVRGAVMNVCENPEVLASLTAQLGLDPLPDADDEHAQIRRDRVRENVAELVSAVAYHYPKETVDALGSVFAGVQRSHALDSPKRIVDVLANATEGISPDGDVTPLQRSTLGLAARRNELARSNTSRHTSEARRAGSASPRPSRGRRPPPPPSRDVRIGSDGATEPETQPLAMRQRSGLRRRADGLEIVRDAVGTAHTEDGGAPPMEASGPLPPPSTAPHDRTAGRSTLGRTGRGE